MSSMKVSCLVVALWFKSAELLLLLEVMKFYNLFVCLKMLFLTL